VSGLRLVVVDDHHLFRQGVRSELAAHFEIVGEADTPAAAIAVITSAAPDVVLLDVHLHDGGAWRCCARWSRRGSTRRRGCWRCRSRRRRGRRADDPRGGAGVRDQDDRHGELVGAI